ncbi:ParB N-terminal domain-containing protein [Rhodoplanes sp. TEM]|uniref:ParB N-terminal domain-containing protein n=1 Tax=Rhodoplanes tepidamans TaxID=200616 RepID=A0ABT5JE95_RHOTP|nr:MULTISPECIES: ParB N-terminal domain-containing protein [Rhodoplanes]MDC7788010.1 ParB N-terminal domain-containing protein [Rhodoplanes tepidamans]MDC7984850.1 ParB N-terminal domain-containing protein [Rhodoplanes sp. TEM]MDQ0358439.1 ParB family chromosome partitioning protein [Rhodoplanes tepidamans]
MSTSPAPASLPQPEDTTLVEIALIDDSDRLRPVDPDWAAAIAASFEERGQDTAIDIRPIDGGRYKLTAGGHRLAAAKLCGWSHILSKVVQRNDLEARLAEIDENLIRAELTALDRAVFLWERKRVWEQLNPAAAHGGDRKSQKTKDNFKSPTWRLDRFSADAAEKCGLSERTIQRACELAEKLGPDTIALLRRTSVADNQTQLQALARLSDDEREAVLGQIGGDLDGFSLSAALRAAGLKPEEDADEAVYRALVGAWSRASNKVKRRFQAHIGKA